MANKAMRNQKINRLKSLSNNLDDARLETLNVDAVSSNVENMDLTYSSYAFSQTTAIPVIKDEETDDVDSLVEYIKNVDAAFQDKPKVKTVSIAERIIERNKNNPKLKRKETFQTYQSSNEESFSLENIGEKTAIDYYLDALDQVKND